MRRRQEKFKRHTKMDDSRMCLYLDAFIPKLREWVRIDMDVVHKDNEGRLKRRAKLTDKKMLFTTDSAGSDEEDKQ